jgi:hypothetical protein
MCDRYNLRIGFVFAENDLRDALPSLTAKIWCGFIDGLARGIMRERRLGQISLAALYAFTIGKLG